MQNLNQNTNENFITTSIIFLLSSYSGVYLLAQSVGLKPEMFFAQVALAIAFAIIVLKKTIQHGKAHQFRYALVFVAIIVPFIGYATAIQDGRNFNDAENWYIATIGFVLLTLNIAIAAKDPKADCKGLTGLQFYFVITTLICSLVTIVTFLYISLPQFKVMLDFSGYASWFNYGGVVIGVLIGFFDLCMAISTWKEQNNKTNTLMVVFALICVLYAWFTSPFAGLFQVFM
ncbi:hypothetical protein [Vibrio sp. 10N.239.312.D08]|uniref:hypothetical protein n=1 Tax=Vibrio sp. 10N.239.312.D08 TaxID=3229978 RepID=UPI00354AE1AD